MPVPTALLTASERSGSDTSRPASHRTNCTSSTISVAPMTMAQPRRWTARRRSDASTMPTVAATAAPAMAPRRMAAVMSCHCQKRYWSSRLVTSDRLSASPPLDGDPGSALPGSWKRAGDDGDRVRQVEPGPVGLPFEQRLVGALHGGPEDGPEGVGVDAGLDGQLEGGPEVHRLLVAVAGQLLGQGRGHLVTDGRRIEQGDDAVAERLAVVDGRVGPAGDHRQWQKQPRQHDQRHAQDRPDTTHSGPGLYPRGPRRSAAATDGRSPPGREPDTWRQQGRPSLCLPAHWGWSP